MTTHMETRIERVRKKIHDSDMDTLMILTDENRRYLSGFTGEDSQFDESAGALLITKDKLVFATDSRFTEQAKNESPLFDVYCYKTGLAKELNNILSTLGTQRLGYESKRLTCYQHQAMTETLISNQSSVVMVPADQILENLRIIKDETEIDQIRRSLAISENAFTEIKKQIKPDDTEKQLAWKLEQIIRNLGAESLSFPSIVAVGPNSALPHAIPGDRKINTGAQLLFDWGAILNAYCSDITRTLFIGKPDDTFKTVFQTVLDAQEKAIQNIRSGVSGKHIDSIARTHIENMGYKGFFGHGLGHGVGLAVHEPPRLSPIKDDTLLSGMVVTVEPGIYIPGWGGVRLENLIVVRDDGAEVLNTLDCLDYIFNIS
ncbi:MAG: Xaa-Pro peptidase family protein [Proteobacteria bacterium]|nr:Xaa-Pro peptidase family protein [Pseudomonadota bacterium]